MSSEQPATAPETPPARTRRSGSGRRGPKWWVVALIAVPAVLLLVVIVAWIAINTFLRGEAFRKLVTDQTNEALYCEGTYEPFSWQGTSMYTAGFSAKGRSGEGYFENVTAANLRADIDLNGVKRGFWTLSQLEIGSLDLEVAGPQGERADVAALNPSDVADANPGIDPSDTNPDPTPTYNPSDIQATIPATGGEAVPDSVTTAAPELQTQPLPLTTETPEPPAAKKGSGSGFWSSWLPQDLELKRIAVRDARIRWAPQPGQAGQLAGTRLEIVPENSADIAAGSVLSGFDGTFRQEGFPEFTVDRYSFRVKPDEIYVQRATMRGPRESLVEATGTIRLDPEVDADLHVKITGYPLTELLQGEWKERLEGRLSGEVHLTGAPTSAEGIAEGTVRLEDGVLQGLPLLEQIAKYTNTQRFLRLQLDEAHTKFRRQSERVEITDLVMESKGLMRVMGGCVVEGNQIDGTFRVGVTATSLQWLLGAEKRVFTESAEGYLWTTVKVTGPLDNPKEDLSNRLVNAAIDETADKVQKVAEDLKKGADEGTRKVIDQGVKLLNSLFGN